MGKSNPMTTAIERAGLTVVATACGVTYQAVRKWERHGLPRTEWTGETAHARAIEVATGNTVRAADLLAWTQRLRGATATGAAA